MSLESSIQLTHIYAFRHSETYRNSKGEEIQGWIDDDLAQLNDKGISAAHELGQKLATVAPNATMIASSDISRSWDTANIVATYYATKLPISKEPRLREKCHGKWDTMSVKIRNGYCLNYYQVNETGLKAANDRFAKWKIEPLSLGEIEPKLPDCKDKLESIYDVFLRGSETFKELGEKYKGKQILVSSHGAFNDIMATEAEYRQKATDELLPVYFEPKARHFPKNCAVYHFIWDSSKKELAFAEELFL